MEGLPWLTVLVLGCVSELPSKAFPGEFGNIERVRNDELGFYQGGAPQKLAFSGHLAVLGLVPQGLAPSYYSW